MEKITGSEIEIMQLRYQLLFNINYKIANYISLY